MNNNNFSKNRNYGNDGLINKEKRRQRKMKQRSKKRKGQFKKFVDTEHNNDKSNYCPQNNRTKKNSRLNGCRNEIVSSAGIHPWIRNKPDTTLNIPQLINFDEQNESVQQSNINNIQCREKEKLTTETNRINKTNIAPTSARSEMVKSNESVSSVMPNVSIKVKPEKDLLNLKREITSTSSSSSSSSTSSSESEPESNKKISVKSEAKQSSTPLLTLNREVKPQTNSASSKSVQIPKNKSSDSSSSSSSDEEPTPPALISMAKKKEESQTLKNHESQNNRTSSEDDVVCVGNLENKIVLEDETEKSSADEEHESETAATSLNNLSKDFEKKTSEKCMICNENDHTSFQCQMICKNCSTPYHGYRTCPQPANLNTMMQLFMEFCMQQLQHYQVDKQTSASDSGNVPKPKVDLSNLTIASKKSNRLKRKQVKTKHRTSKKRKLSASKKTKSKAISDESSDDISDDDTDTKTSSTESDEKSSDSSVESLVSSKKKRKLKTKNASKAALKSSSANPLSMPMVLNGFPHMAVSNTHAQNSNTSTNALNTLFLTQMFQNAIDSLKK